MQIVSIEKIHEDHIREMAEQAADFGQGPETNPFPLESLSHEKWDRFYSARMSKNTLACAA